MVSHTRVFLLFGITFFVTGSVLLAVTLRGIGPVKAEDTVFATFVAAWIMCFARPVTFVPALLAYASSLLAFGVSFALFIRTKTPIKETVT